MIFHSSKTYILFCFLLLFCSVTNAQNIKGLNIADYHPDKFSGKTYALVVGVSKYKNTAIPSLQYADKDAYTFYEYLRNTGIDTNNIILLLNEKATNGDFWASINYLTDVSKSGDKIYIYFSGHGDVENKTVVKDAYLLPYDAPKCVYPAGAIPVLQLKSWIATWSANNIQVVFIADACRSGNLAGGREGMEATASILKEKWKDEVKILSCQPGELSLEGKQWGNGRGLFSYYLINGLYGLADNDKDGKVTLRELNMYLMSKVAEDAKPQDQDPMLFGTMSTVLAYVNTKQLELLKNQKETPLFAAVETRGFDEGLLKGVDDSTKMNYQLFKTYLDSGILLRKPPQPSAYLYFFKVPDNPSTHALHALMTRNYSAALMKDIDAGFNYINQNKIEKIGKSGARTIAFEGQILRQILGDDILKRQTFYAKAMFWDAMRCIFTNTLSGREAILKIDSALAVDSTASYAYMLKGTLFSEKSRCDEAIQNFEKAILYAPQMTYAYDAMKGCYINTGRYDELIAKYNLLSKYDTLCKIKAYQQLENVYHLTGKEDSAILYKNKQQSFIEHITENEIIRLDIAREIAVIFYNSKDYEKSVHYDTLAYNNNRSGEIDILYDIACCYSLLKKKTDALKYFELALDNHFDGFTHIQEDTDLDNIRTTPEFIALMKKHFPDKYKN